MFDRTSKRRRRIPHDLTVSDVARMTGFTSGAVRYWISEGQLKATFDGYRYEMKEKELEKFLSRFYTNGKESKEPGGK